MSRQVKRHRDKRRGPTRRPGRAGGPPRPVARAGPVALQRAPERHEKSARHARELVERLEQGLLRGVEPPGCRLLGAELGDRGAELAQVAVDVPVGTSDGVPPPLLERLGRPPVVVPEIPKKSLRSHAAPNGPSRRPRVPSPFARSRCQRIALVRRERRSRRNRKTSGSAISTLPWTVWTTSRRPSRSRWKLLADGPGMAGSGSIQTCSSSTARAICGHREEARERRDGVLEAGVLLLHTTRQRALTHARCPSTAGSSTGSFHERSIASAAFRSIAFRRSSRARPGSPRWSWRACAGAA